MSLRCDCGLHKWSRWDAFHRWCRRCGKVQLTPLGERLMQKIGDLIA